jgi:hypothetical protein
MVNSEQSTVNRMLCIRLITVHCSLFTDYGLQGDETAVIPYTPRYDAERHSKSGRVGIRNEK